ncbi:MAG: succinylglutamate desuccinylase/aspartoacylase family protein [Deltaproteobacteria bacterium]|nr:succinylglutamate desuccinylase/aspartoacylase family protein [Deltaproteobacteria bacterium]
MTEVIQIGNISVAPGEKKLGRLEVARRPDASRIYIPLMIVNGSADGPVLNVSSGCHGDEFEGSVAIRRWWRALDPNSVNGAFIGVPVINVSAYEAGTRTSWVDQLNLNRVYPGKPDGKLTEKLAHVYLTEVVYKADMVMDLHGGGNIQVMGNQTVWRTEPGKAETIEKSLALAKATGFEYIWVGSGGWGGTVTVEALKKNIPAITVEAGGEGRCLEPIVKVHEKLIGNVLKTFGMIDGDPEQASQFVMFKGTFMQCTVGGLFTPMAEPHEHVREGQVLGTVADLYGEVVETIKAPSDGIVSSKRTFPVVQPGDWVVQFGQIIEE